MASRGGLGAVLLVLVTVTLASCGSQPPPADETRSSATAAESVPPPTPSASALVAAVSHTRGLGTARLTIDARMTIDGAERTLNGSGATALDQGYADLTWTDERGERTRELSNSKGLFVQTDPPAGRWVRLADRDQTPTGPLGEPLRGLGALLAVVEDGREVLDGVPARRFVGRLPGPAGDLEATVWVDDSGRVIRVDRDWELPTGSARTTTILSAFSDIIDLSPPPSESVDEPPDSQ